MEISVILPCKNEEKSIGICIKKIKSVLKGRDYEIIVSDSSKDKSAEIARGLGVKVIKHNLDGYGNACIKGFKYAEGDYIIMGDADNTYDFLEIPKLLRYIDKYDLILGRRKFIHERAMSKLHKYIGNPVLSLVLRMLFKAKVKDAHTGFRVIKKEKLEKLNLRTTGMEFASEMIIKAIKNKLKIKEVPIHYYKRKGTSKLKSFRDGWKHLRFMLLYSPLFLFLIPGLVIFLFGILSMILLYFDLISIGNIKLYYHPMFVSSLCIVFGFQLMIFALFTKTYAITHLSEHSFTINLINKIFTIEKSIMMGSFIFILGLIVGLYVLFKWITTGFGGLTEIKLSIITLTLIFIGIQTIFSSFMLSILGIKER